MAVPHGQRHPRGVKVSDRSTALSRSSLDVSGNGTNHPSIGLLDTLEKSVEDLRGLITCRICVRPMYEPYTIACGHTFCYSCLTQWFSNHTANKTCPDCRTRVIQQPAPAYVLREITQIFVTRVELIPKGETIEDHKKHSEEEASLVERDRLNTDERRGGIFRGCFIAGSSISRQPIRDDEDGVMRCPICAWELEDGYCNACGTAYDTDGVPYDVEGIWSDDGDDESDGSLQHYGNGFGPPISDDDNELAGLVGMGDTEDDISLDGEGNSVHTESEGHMGRGDFAFARTAAQGLLDRPSRRYFVPDRISQRRYASSLLSDDGSSNIGIGHEHEYEGGHEDQSNPSDEGDGSDEETGSLDQFTVQDETKYEDGTDDEPTAYNFSPILGDGLSDDERQNAYASESERESEISIVNSDDEEPYDECTADGRIHNGNSDLDESETDSTVGQGHRPHRNLGHVGNQQLPIQLTTSESEAEVSPNRAPRTERIMPRHARSAARISSRLHDKSMNAYSDSDPPSRTRKRRNVVNEASSDERSSDVEPSRRHKRNRNRNATRQNIVEV